MSEQAVKDEILDPMQRLFTPPKAMEADQQAKALKDYLDALRAFSREELQLAWRDVRDNAMSRSWPPIAIFVNAAANAKSSIRGKSSSAEIKGPRHKYDTEGWHAYFWELWKWMRHQPLALEACQDGWALMLRASVLDGISPDHIEPQTMRRKIERAARLYKIIEEKHNFPNRELCLSMYEGVRTQRLAAETEIAESAGFGPPRPYTPAFDYPYKSAILKDPPEHQMRIYD